MNSIAKTLVLATFALYNERGGIEYANIWLKTTESENMNPSKSDVESLAENILAMLRSQGYEPSLADEKEIRDQLKIALEDGDFFAEFERVGGALGAAQNYLEARNIFHEKDEATLVKDIGLLGADIAPISLVLRFLWIFAIILSTGMFALAPIVFGVFTSDAIALFYSVAYFVYASLIIIPLTLLQVDKTSITIFLKEHKRARILLGFAPLTIGLINSVLGFVALIIGQLSYNIALLNEHLRFVSFFFFSSLIFAYSWPFSSPQLDRISKSDSILASNQSIMKFVLLSVVYLGLLTLLIDPLNIVIVISSKGQSISPTLLLPFTTFFWSHIILSFIIIYYIFTAKEYIKQKHIIDFKLSIVNFLFVTLLFLRFYLMKKVDIAIDQKMMFILYGFLVLTFPWRFFSEFFRMILKRFEVEEELTRLKAKIALAKDRATVKYRNLWQSATSKIQKQRRPIERRRQWKLPSMLTTGFGKGKELGGKIGRKSRKKFIIWRNEFKRKFTIFPLGNNASSLDSLVFWILTFSAFIVMEALRYEFLHPRNSERHYYLSPGSTLVSFTQGLDFLISFFYLWLFLEVSLAIILIRSSASLPRGIGIGGLVAEALNRAMYAWMFRRVVSDLEYWGLFTNFQIELIKWIGYFVLALHVLRWLLNLGRTEPLGLLEFALIQFITIVVFLVVWSLWGQFFFPRLLRLLL